MRTAIWVTGFTMTLTPTMTYFQTGTMTFTLGMSMLAPARRTYPSGGHMAIVVRIPPLLFHSSCGVFTHIPTSYSITVNHSRLLSFISFLFSFVLCSGIARFFDIQDGQTQWSPITKSMNFSKNQLSLELLSICLNNLKFFEKRKS